MTTSDGSLNEAASRMTHLMLAPLSDQSDLGFAAMGIAFFDAAERLQQDEGSRSVGQGHLPLLYLYRHAVELLLKSCIIILWRRFRASSEPSINELRISTKSTITQTHDIAALYDYLQRFWTECGDRMQAKSVTRWDDALPTEIGYAIAVVSAYDKSGTYLRYPSPKVSTQELEKSAFKASDAQELQASLERNPESVIACVFVNENKSVVGGWLLDEDSLSELHAALTRVGRFLKDLAIAVHAEFGGSQ